MAAAIGPPACRVPSQRQAVSSAARLQTFVAPLAQRMQTRRAVRATAQPATPANGEGGSGIIHSVGQWLKEKQANTAAVRAKVAAVGLAAVLAYGFFDGVSYTAAFTLAFLSYEKATGLNPTANIKAILGIMVAMWAGNNVTRPFRVAGAAALAPWIDGRLKAAQARFGIPYSLAFALAVAAVAIPCLSVVGLLILSRIVW